MLPVHVLKHNVVCNCVARMGKQGENVGDVGRGRLFIHSSLSNKSWAGIWDLGIKH